MDSIKRFFVPFALIIFAFSYFGPIGGAVTFVIIVLLLIYLNRSIYYQNRASKKYHNGDYDGAINDLKTAVSYEPKGVKLRGTYAYLLLKLGHTEEASTQIDEALKMVQLDIDRNKLKVTKALVLWKQGKVDEGILLLDELLCAYETTNIYATLGFLYIEKGDYLKALEFNLRAEEYNRSSAIILDNLGTSYLLLGDYDKAFETYQEVMKLKPKFPEAYYNYARVLEQKDDLEKALYMVRHSLTLQFWNTSTVSKEEIEAYLAELEIKEKALELEFRKNKNKESTDSNEG